MILSCLISLSVIFLVKCNEDWLYLQVHTDDATCLSTVKQIEAVRVGRCQRDTTLFSVLFPNYPIQKYIDFSYQILLTSYTDKWPFNSSVVEASPFSRACVPEWLRQDRNRTFNRRNIAGLRLNGK